MSDTVVITVAAHNSLIDKSSAIQWPSVRKGLQAATPSADGIESVKFTCRFMEDQPAVFTDAQESEAEPCVDSHAFTNTIDNPIKATSTHEGRTAADCVPTVDREIVVYAHGVKGHAVDVCLEAQLMAGNSVVYLDDEGPFARLLQWIAGICGGSWDFTVHASPEAQLMAGNDAIYQNGLVQWLLR